MQNELKEKYGLGVAICMVIGIVIGGGVFFKAEKILTATGGSQPLGILAWIIGGAIMVVCAGTFAVMATRYSYVNGLVDYAEVTCGGRYAYFIGWFMAIIYYPTLTGVLAWVSARFACILFGFEETGGAALAFSAFFLCASFALNALSPILAGKFQVATTVIKLIPLLLMGIVGLIVGLNNGMTVQNFTTVVDPSKANAHGLLTAVVATSFAYEGWIISTSINAELKNSKRNLPIALMVGSVAIIAIYVLYYVGLTGVVQNSVMMKNGSEGARLAFQTVFSKAGGTLLYVFIVISCLGTLNGLMLACSRGLYSLACRGKGPHPALFAQVDPISNMPTNSAIFGLLLCGAWLLYFYGANLADPLWFGKFSFDVSELPIVTVYGLYIPIFISMMKKERELPFGQRFVLPFLALCGSCFMIFAACMAHGISVVYYLLLFAVIMLLGIFFRREGPVSVAS